jgi:hypothetical protein
MQAHAVENFQIIKHFPHIQHFKIPKDLKLSKLYTSQFLVFLQIGLAWFTSVKLHWSSMELHINYS